MVAGILVYAMLLAPPVHADSSEVEFVRSVLP